MVPHLPAIMINTMSVLLLKGKKKPFRLCQDVEYIPGFHQEQNDTEILQMLECAEENPGCGGYRRDKKVFVLLRGTIC